MGRFKKLGCGLVVWMFALLVCHARDRETQKWTGTWATAPQRPIAAGLETFADQTLRLIVHTSAGGSKVRIKVSNVFGDQPLVLGAAHIGRRTSEADIDPASDRSLTFRGQRSTTIAAGATAVSDPVELDVPALSVFPSA